jgi:glycine/D-amino acid oxidase-like deaminating enzyme/nitrite reductase/ring-hydroxylating ferredoxin subunit
MINHSLWLDSARLPRFPALSRNLTVDVVVIGGGITGTTAAYLIKQRGYRVALLERGRCGGVDSSYTTAHLTCVTDVRLHALVKLVGKENARLAWEAGLASLDQIVANIRELGISCDFRWIPGYLHATPGQGDTARKGLIRDAHMARDLGFHATYVEKTPYFHEPGVQVAHQARFHPLDYASGLLRAIPGEGSHVFENTEATGFSRAPLWVKAGKYRIHCAYVVIATHNPLQGNTPLVRATLMQTRLYPYTSYAIAAKAPKDMIPDALFWDTNDPYYYLRIHPQPAFDYIIFGGQDHKTGQSSDTEAVFDRLQRVLQRRFPSARPTHRWSGQVIETADGLPFMGETCEHQFAITGCSGNGMTLGTLGAMMAADAVERRNNPWTKLFHPRRKRMRGALTYLKENRAYPYYMIRDWLATPEGRPLRTLKRNQGAILNCRDRKVAAYRDEHGRLSLRSPICTHLKCIVGWNAAERTWDCPCHGSRFTPDGKVLAGPAEEDLQSVDV